MNKFPDFDNQKVYVCGLQCFMSNGGGGGEGGSEWLSSHKEETFIQLITTSAKLL